MPDIFCGNRSRTKYWKLHKDSPGRSRTTIQDTCRTFKPHFTGIACIVMPNDDRVSSRSSWNTLAVSFFTCSNDDRPSTKMRSNFYSRLKSKVKSLLNVLIRFSACWKRSDAAGHIFQVSPFAAFLHQVYSPSCNHVQQRQHWLHFLHAMCQFQENCNC